MKWILISGCLVGGRLIWETVLCFVWWLSVNYADYFSCSRLKINNPIYIDLMEACITTCHRMNKFLMKGTVLSFDNYEMSASIVVSKVLGCCKIFFLVGTTILSWDIVFRALKIQAMNFFYLYKLYAKVSNLK